MVFGVDLGLENPKVVGAFLGRQLFGVGSQRSLDERNRIVIGNPIEGVDGELQCLIIACMSLISLSMDGNFYSTIPKADSSAVLFLPVLPLGQKR